MYTTVKGRWSSSYSSLQNLSRTNERAFSSKLTASSPLSLYIFRMQQALKKTEASFGNTPRQQKKRSKFNRRFKLVHSYPLERLQQCLLQACYE